MTCVVMQLAFVTTTSESFKQIKLWIDYHKSIGVNHFYLFVDGQVRHAHGFVSPCTWRCHAICREASICLCSGGQAYTSYLSSVKYCTTNDVTPARAVATGYAGGGALAKPNAVWAGAAFAGAQIRRINFCMLLALS